MIKIENSTTKVMLTQLIWLALRPFKRLFVYCLFITYFHDCNLPRVYEWLDKYHMKLDLWRELIKSTSLNYRCKYICCMNVQKNEEIFSHDHYILSFDLHFGVEITYLCLMHHIRQFGICWILKLEFWMLHNIYLLSIIQDWDYYV